MKKKIESLAKKVTKASEGAKPHLQKVRRKHLLAAGGALVLLLAISLVGASRYYVHRALPGVQVAGESVSGKSAEEITQVVQSRQKALKIDFVHDKTKDSPDLKNIGLGIDAQKTVDQALQAGRHQGFWRPLAFWQKNNVPLATTLDKDKLKAYVATKFPQIIKGAKDARMTYNEETKQFEITPGESGQGFDIQKIEQLLPDLAAHPRAVTLAVSSTIQQPAITAQALEPLKKQANERNDLSIRFLYHGQLKYFADPPDIASWATLTPDKKTGKVSISYDKSKIKQFLTSKVGPYIATPPQDRKVIKDEKTGKEIVIQEGHIGLQLKGIDELADEIATAVTNNTPWEKEVSVEEAPFKTVALNGYDRWIEIDLSEQRTTLYTGATPVASFTISSGLARTPTVTGEFAIWYKTPSQTMTGGSRASGDYYSLPNVTWVSYFYKDYSFHTAYWHNNFGTPMSHGCVNMRAADAKVLYDFAPIGTKVISHL